MYVYVFMMYVCVCVYVYVYVQREGSMPAIAQEVITKKALPALNRPLHDPHPTNVLCLKMLR